MEFKRCNFYLPVELVERLKELKKETGVPISIMVRRAIIEYIKKIENQDGLTK